ncbi:hypothetical protein [Enhygromyxa salina]|uniref:DUF3352 domain-containing protein n=1 Tax=Enhygromyxa salina TaxID=215803 RepID=A0A2S9YKV4_9BACT|nr:hypothetical protein [Enhygromyxa salina]PRQ05719.1 hypothetical protein ENSA7_43900 [Enhygromyxa salina]
MGTRASWAVVSASLWLAVCGCKPEAPPVSAPERAGAEPTGIGPVVIVEAPTVPLGCQATTPIGGALLIPEAAQWLVRISPAQLMHSAFWSALGSEVESGELSELFAGLRECGLEPASFQDVLIGFESENENYVMVVQGPGVGQSDLATCAVQVMRRQLPGEKTMEVEASLSPGAFGGPPMIPFDNGVAYLISPDELVFASLAWQYEVGQLAQCMGQPALESSAIASLAPLISRVDTRADLWMIGHVPPSLASIFLMFGGPSQGPSDVAMTVDFSSGFGFDMSLTLDSAATAEQARTALQTSLDQLAANGNSELERFLAGVSLEASGPRLLLHGWISAERLPSLLP